MGRGRQYRKEFNNNPKHVLTAQIRHSRSESCSDEFISESVRGDDSGALALDTNIQLNASIRTVAQLDFEKPLSGNGWEWGWKSNCPSRTTVSNTWPDSPRRRHPGPRRAGRCGV